jgi:hypothetical protein
VRVLRVENLRESWFNLIIKGKESIQTMYIHRERERERFV